jgi:hypothetical protein
MAELLPRVLKKILNPPFKKSTASLSVAMVGFESP